MVILRSRKGAILRRYEDWLVSRELAPNTVDKYTRDVGRLLDFALGQAAVARLSKRLVVAYKKELVARYSPVSANSMIAAVNSFLAFSGNPEMRIGQIRVQSRTYCSEDEELTKPEYERLVGAAAAKGDVRAKLALETLCSTGMRVGELECLSVEALLKGKARQIWLPDGLRDELIAYCEDAGIASGPVFRTRSGRALHRSSVWKAMKSLADEAGVDRAKAYPHNLRHLFARTYYEKYKDLSSLGDVLGHSSLSTTKIYIVSTGLEHRRQLSELGLVA